MYLTGNLLKTLNTEICKLTQLKTLDLSCNNLTTALDCNNQYQVAIDRIYNTDGEFLEDDTLLYWEKEVKSRQPNMIYNITNKQISEEIGYFITHRGKS